MKKTEIYLMERNAGLIRNVNAVLLSGRREIKIGISNNPDRRRKEVDEGIPGSFKILKTYRISNPRKTEAELHKKYAQYNYVPKRAKRGSGRTEIFRLTNDQISDIDSYLSGLENQSSVTQRLLLSVIGAAITYLIIIKLFA